MGTNFYTMDGKHVGKRSAAGWFCWDCGVTLCKAGNAGVHLNKEWYESCPKCGSKPEEESLEGGSVGRELGFNTSSPCRKTGVKSCASFTWAVPPESIRQKRSFRDGYDRRYSKEEFDAVLEECPIQYYDSIGHIFS